MLSFVVAANDYCHYFTVMLIITSARVPLSVGWFVNWI